MTNANRKRRDEIINHAALYGLPATAGKYQINEETIRVYRRASRAEDNVVKKILIFDIETAPMLGYFWDIWQQNIATVQILEDWSILCWAAKWLDGDEIFSDASWLHSKKPRKDKRICMSLSKLLNQADIVVAHNGDKFDIKRVNTRLLFHGIQEPTPFKSVDTLKIVKSRFAITSNKLDYVAQFLNIGRKIKHEGQAMWNKVLDGDKESQDKMIEYNIGDITLLEQVYLGLRSWDKRHPNINVQFGERKCPVCGSNDLRRIDEVYTPVSKFSAMVCKECGKYSRTGQHKKTKQEMSLTQRNIV